VWAKKALKEDRVVTVHKTMHLKAKLTSPRGLVEPEARCITWLLVEVDRDVYKYFIWIPRFGTSDKKFLITYVLVKDLLSPKKMYWNLVKPRYSDLGLEQQRELLTQIYLRLPEVKKIEFSNGTNLERGLTVTRQSLKPRREASVTVLTSIQMESDRFTFKERLTCHVCLNCTHKVDECL
jgi:hypothetical protein